MKKFDVLILGGGSAGITVAARLKRKGVFNSIAIIDPSDEHFYQPLWTLVGNGLVDKTETKKPMKDVIPSGVIWLQESVTEILPKENQVKTNNETYEYTFLVVATGIIPDWSYAKGLEETIGKNQVFSVYTYDSADYGFEVLKGLDKGRLFFTMPSGLLKCGGAPQKIMWLSEDYIAIYKDRSQFQVNFMKEGDGIFGVEKYRKVLDQLVIDRDIKTHYKNKLISVDGENKRATFEDLATGIKHEVCYDLLHVVPHFKTHDFVSGSELANEKGEIAVDKHTLQGDQFKNVFSLGDRSSCPTGKTGAAIRKQAPVLVENMIAYHQGRSLDRSYDGYTACPVLTRRNKVVLAEFDYDGQPAESFPFNQAKERFSMYIFKRYILPILYWVFMLRGLI